jgi:hypothetical protein
MQPMLPLLVAFGLPADPEPPPHVIWFPIKDDVTARPGTSDHPFIDGLSFRCHRMSAAVAVQTAFRIRGEERPDDRYSLTITLYDADGTELGSATRSGIKDGRITARLTPPVNRGGVIYHSSPVNSDSRSIPVPKGSRPVLAEIRFERSVVGSEP